MRMPPILISGARLIEMGLPRISRAFRAHLRVACLAAMMLQMSVLAAMVVFRIPEEIFSSNDFRGFVALLLICVVAMVREMANIAFDAALKRDDATFTGNGNCPSVSISAACPLRALVVLHVQLAGLPQDMFCR